MARQVGGLGEIGLEVVELPGTGLHGDEVVFDFESLNLGPYALTRRYLHGPAVDQVFAQENIGEDISAASRVYWLLDDRQGTTRDIVDHTGGVVQQFAYTAFGEIVGGDPTLTRYLYTGREFDFASELQYNRARWIDAGTASWASEDPTGFGGGDANLYRYVWNSPTNGRDAYGTWAEPIINLSKVAPPGEDVSAELLIAVGRAIAGGAQASGGSLTSGQRALIEHGYNLALQEQGGLQYHAGYYDEFGWHRTFCMSCHDSSNPNSVLKNGVASFTVNSSWPTFIAEQAINLAMGFGLGFAVGEAETVVNAVPSTFARVVPGDISLTGLGITERVFVTDAALLRGLSATEIAEVLEIPAAESFQVIEFGSAGVNGIATPIRSGAPRFVGRGLTSGGMPEFTVPNGPLPPDSFIWRIK